MSIGVVHGAWTLVILVFFIAMVIRVCRRDVRARLEAAARIPLDDGEDRPHGGAAHHE